jgi:hypothetical protein
VTPFPARFSFVETEAGGAIKADSNNRVITYEAEQTGRTYAVRNDSGNRPMSLTFVQLRSGSEDLLVQIVMAKTDGHDVSYFLARREGGTLRLLEFETSEQAEAALRRGGGQFSAQRRGLVQTFFFADGPGLLASARTAMEAGLVRRPKTYRIATTPQEMAALTQDVAARVGIAGRSAPTTPTAAQTPMPRRQPEPGSDNTHACDIQAAHANDPDRMAPGVQMSRIVPRVALQACERAVAELPGTARFHSQLGRARFAAGQMPEAIEALTRAGEMGHAQSWVILGFAYGDGAFGPADLERAAAYYRRAAAAGRDVQLELSTVLFDPAGYSTPPVVEALFAGRTAGLDQRYTTLYLQQFLSDISVVEDCRAQINQRTLGTLGAMSSMETLGTLFGGLVDAHRNRTGNLDDAARQGAAAGFGAVGSLLGPTMSARADVRLFVQRHGCITPVSARFFRNVNRYIGG